MSFNINGPTNIPAIQEAQNMMNNGGGGNLGYFMRGDSDDAPKFANAEEEDCFEKSVEIEELKDDEELSLLVKFLRFLERIWRSFILKFFANKKAEKNIFASDNK